MGTNYYVQKAIRPSKIEEIKNLVTPENLYNGKLQEAINEFEEIHIGKSSCGWQFCFDHNDWKYYDKTKESINKFISDEILKGGKFIDEYGDSITLKDFWDMVESKKDGFNLKSAYEQELKEYREYQIDPDKFKDRYFKPRCPSLDYTDYPETITNEGLRFSYSTDFC